MSLRSHGTQPSESSTIADPSLPPKSGICRLLKVEPEMRLGIYDFVWADISHKRISCFPHGAEGNVGCIFPGSWLNEKTVALFRTCHIIYREAFPSFYQTVIFEVTLWKSTSTPVPRCIRTGTEIGRYLRSIALRMPMFTVIDNATAIDQLCATIQVPATQVTEISTVLFNLNRVTFNHFSPSYYGHLPNGQPSDCLEEYKEELSVRQLDLSANTFEAKIWSALIRQVELKVAVMEERSQARKLEQREG
ncbi:uncharacterized protein LTR77_007066 [Saxophila tyrrhenica]|uniref:Uncharacterized protein n=1 Tax=Saxophila tyrrhenica TaxID=1690608 RepID=A0AAV9P452_9PEZI|nr:hypothetical protein LTR77_007066 [Saxophila tyrrhenica]